MQGYNDDESLPNFIKWKHATKGEKKGTWRKDPSLGRQTKPKNKDRPPRRKGTNHILNPSPLTLEASKGNA